MIRPPPLPPFLTRTTTLYAQRGLVANPSPSTLRAALLSLHPVYRRRDINYKVNPHLCAAYHA